MAGINWMPTKEEDKKHVEAINELHKEIIKFLEKKNHSPLAIAEAMVCTTVGILLDYGLDREQIITMVSIHHDAMIQAASMGAH